jgi:hypothetical protein
MKQLLGMPSVQIALCLAVFAGVGWRFGAFGLVLASPLLGAATARSIMALAANLRQRARENVWLPLHGQRFVFRDKAIRVLEDESHFRWVSLPDARAVANIIASDRALAVTYPGRFQAFGRPARPHLRDDALVEHLGKHTDLVTLKFRTWVERTIVMPGANVRKGLGIRDDLLDDAGDTP